MKTCPRCGAGVTYWRCWQNGCHLARYWAHKEGYEEHVWAWRDSV